MIIIVLGRTMRVSAMNFMSRLMGDSMGNYKISLSLFLAFENNKKKKEREIKNEEVEKCVQPLAGWVCMYDTYMYDSDEEDGVDADAGVQYVPWCKRCRR